MNILEEYTTRTEAAKLIGITKEALWRHMRLGHLPTVRIGHEYLIRCEHVRDFIQARAVGKYCTPGRPKNKKEAQ